MSSPVCVVFLVVVAATAPPRLKAATGHDPPTPPCSPSDYEDKLSDERNTSSPEPVSEEATTVPCPADPHTEGSTQVEAAHSAVQQEEAELEELTSVLKDLGLRVRPSQPGLARSGVLVQILQKIRREGLAGQVIGSRGGTERGGNGRNKDDVRDVDDPLGKDAVGGGGGGDGDAWLGRTGGWSTSCPFVLYVPLLNCCIYAF